MTCVKRDVIWSSFIPQKSSKEIRISKLMLLKCKYEIISIEENKTIQSMIERFKIIINRLRSQS